MSTYFRQTNLTPLVAWVLEMDLIYSSNLSEQVGDAALLVDPDSADEVSQTTLLIINKNVKAKLIDAGKIRLSETNEDRLCSELKLMNTLHHFTKRREC